MNKSDRIKEALGNLEFQMDRIEVYSNLLSKINNLIVPNASKEEKENIIWALKVFLWDLQEAARDSMNELEKEVE